MKKKGWVILTGVLMCSILAHAEEKDAKVISVIDGNTLEVKTADNGTYRVVLAGVDCPELAQEFGNAAKEFLEKIAFKKNVKVLLQGKDRKGNQLAIVTLKGEDLRVELLKAGLAWTAERNASPELEIIRVQAEEKGKGLWKNEEPTPPWVFRRQQTLLQEKSS